MNSASGSPSSKVRASLGLRVCMVRISVTNASLSVGARPVADNWPNTRADTRADTRPSKWQGKSLTAAMP
ncbi:hypothetical protein Cmtc_31610 [Cupriavidus sp. TKC]|nr:hypothetical protein Cmtc_31610 [Cupriavidus sp. TKC]